MKPSSILLTGANGFTGQYLMRLGKSLGHNLNILKANINDVDVLEAEIATLSPDYVIHLAGISFVASKDHEAFYRVHALGTGNLLKALIHLPTAPKKNSLGQ